jgi:hypothetical protein
LINAARFGPWKDDIQVNLMWMGLDSWYDLSQEARLATVATVERGLQRQAAKTIEIIDIFPAWPELCGVEASLESSDVPNDATPQITAECQKRSPADPVG